MFEIAQDLEQAAVWFKPAVLIWPGLAAVLLGLFIWLGGLGFRRTLDTIIGIISGGIFGFFISGRSTLTAMISAGIGVVVAILFERILITILTSVLVAVLVFAVLATPYTESEGSLKHSPEHETQNIKMYLDTQESIKMMKRFTADFVIEAKWIFSQMPVYKRAIIAALAVFFIAAGCFKQRLTPAFCCALLGTTLVFAGMILLLLYKGAAPISRIYNSPLFYQSIFGIMTAFGMAEQLFFCQQTKRKPMIEKAKSKEGKEPVKTPKRWRNK